MELSFRAKAKQRVVQIGAEVALRCRRLTTPKASIEHQLNGLRALLRTLSPVSTNYPLIRLGNEGDGGYLVPDDLIGVNCCFSPGVSVTADFEVALAARNIRSYLADYSVDTAPAESPLIQFERKYLGDHNDSIHMTLSSWVERKALPEDGDLLLQMDIEGDEYRVLVETPREVLIRFRILIIEFHFLDALFSPAGSRFIGSTFTRLLRDFSVVHIHPNNYCRPIRYRDVVIPPVMEFTFLRSDRVTSSIPSTHYPHPFDRPNDQFVDDLALPRCWYQHR